VEELEKQELVTNYFLQLFSTSVAPGEEQLRQLLDAVSPSITLETNDLLLGEFTPEEVKAALDAIGMPPVFFKKYWDIVGD